jgi:hypothetical protein
MRPALWLIVLAERKTLLQFPHASSARLPDRWSVLSLFSLCPPFAEMATCLWPDCPDSTFVFPEAGKATWLNLLATPLFCWSPLHALRPLWYHLENCLMKELSQWWVNSKVTSLIWGDSRTGWPQLRPVSHRALP